MASLHGTVTAVELITPRMRRIRITATELRGLAWKPGQQVRVHAAADPAESSGKGPRRTYSISSYQDDSIELCVLDHGVAGPGTAWSRRIGVGQPVTFGKPEGKFVLQQAPYHLFAGEETASVAFGPMLRALPANAPAYGVVEVDTAEDRISLPESITWRFREGASAASSQTLVEAVAKLTLPDEPGIAYLAGEARTIQLVRRHLVGDRNWPRRNVLTKPFWTPGKTGMD
ncbi:MAG TPA: siderophore-interacting protein [Pseudonocardiaceae bacterium]|jgi:NADPH-dependent ferric siderophore reductase|nr:siderophore-interacting protein [Pseudonocardiaceae bacterium]